MDSIVRGVAKSQTQLSDLHIHFHSAYKLNKQGDNIQPWHTPFLVWNQSVVPWSSSNYCFLTCIQISQEAGQVVWYSHLWKNSPQSDVIHTVKGFGTGNKADVFLELSCFFNDPTDLAIWSLVPLPFLNLAWTCGVLGSRIVEAYLGEFWVLLC